MSASFNFFSFAGLPHRTIFNSTQGVEEVNNDPLVRKYKSDIGEFTSDAYKQWMSGPGVLSNRPFEQHVLSHPYWKISFHEWNELVR